MRGDQLVKPPKIRIKLDSKFDSGKSGLEVVTLTKEADGQWRVSDYAMQTGDVP